MILLAVLSAACAPLPFARLPVPEAVLAVPGLPPAELAARLGAPAFLAAALAASNGPADWVSERLRIIPEQDGVRLAMPRCAPAQGLAVLEAITAHHVRAHAPRHPSVEKRIEAVLADKSLSPKHRQMVLEYVRALRRHQAKGLVFLSPRLPQR